MHITDIFLSPVVAVSMLIISVLVLAFAIKRVQQNPNEEKISLMGVLSSFVFILQIFNFAIPNTGVHGNLVGGMLLSILLGPYAGFITICSVIIIQAFFFMDGGIFALGCNIFNMGVCPSFIAYPLIYSNIIKHGYSTNKIYIAVFLSTIIATQLGTIGVVWETILSKKIIMPITNFILLMHSINFIFSIIEGVITATVVNFIWKVYPGMLYLNIVNSRVKKIC